MATALHTRYLLTTDLRDQHADAEKQLTALEHAQELDLGVEADIEGHCLDVQFHGPADTVARLVERCDEDAVFITRVTPSTEEETGILTGRVGDITEVCGVYSSHP